MEAHLPLYRDLMLIFVAAVVGGLAAWRLHLPLIVGYVVGGIAISPFTPGVKIHDVHVFEELAEVGVVLLMFSIGVEFSLKDLLKVKWVAGLGGPIGIAMSIGLAFLLGKVLRWTTAQSFVIGAALSVASTMVLARFLTDRGALSTTWGRVTIGITLVEDLAVVLMTVLIPSFAGSGEGQWAKVGWVLGKAIVLLIPLGFFSMKIIPIVLRRVGKTGDDELMLLAAVAICLGTAALAYTVGFSLALGAFLAGLAISGSQDLHHCARETDSAARCVCGDVFRLAGHADRAGGAAAQPAPAGGDDRVDYRREVRRVGDRGGDFPVSDANGDCGGGGAYANWGTFVRCGSHGAGGGYGRRRRL